MPVLPASVVPVASLAAPVIQPIIQLHAADNVAVARAEIAPDAAAAMNGAEIVLKVRAPLAAGEGELDEVALLPRGALLLGQLGTDGASAYAERGVDAGSMELLPRITRAQSMDILSSQANLAGYRAGLLAGFAVDVGGLAASGDPVALAIMTRAGAEVAATLAAALDPGVPALAEQTVDRELRQIVLERVVRAGHVLGQAHAVGDELPDLGHLLDHREDVLQHVDHAAVHDGAFQAALLASLAEQTGVTLTDA